MARKTKLTQTQEVPQGEDPASVPDRPLLDMSDAAIKAVVRSASKRGYVTHDEINALSKEINSEQIEDVLAMLSGLGINLVEPEEASDDDEQRDQHGITAPRPRDRNRPGRGRAAWR